MWWILCPLTVILLGLYTPEPADLDILLIAAASIGGDAGKHLEKTCAEVQRRRSHPRLGLIFWTRKLRDELNTIKGF